MLVKTPLCAVTGKHKLCPACTKCVYCTPCKCMRCATCGKLVIRKDICVRCSRCKEHHEEVVPRGEFPFRSCTYIPKNPPTITYLYNPLRRKIGIELECGVWDSSHPKGLPRQYFFDTLIGFFDHDGSVLPSAHELILYPMLGDQLYKHIGMVTAQMTQWGADAGPTAGYHVHVDAMMATPEELRRVLFAWAAIEPQVYGTLVDKTRAKNKYCVPVRHDFTLSKIIQWMRAEGEFNIMNLFYDWLYGIQLPVPTDGPNRALALHRAEIKRQLTRLKEHKYENTARRKALNFHAWMMRGTIEFRLKEGTTNPTDILMWAQFCGWFVEKSITTLTDSQVLGWFLDPGTLPTLPGLCALFSGGPQARLRMPSEVVAWVEGKCRKK